MDNKSIWDMKFRIKHADIAIIGGGVVGCSIANALADAKISKHKIFVFEEDRIGSGASSKNDGQIIMSGNEHYNRLSSNLGRENAKRVTEFKLNSVKNIYAYDRKVGSLTWAYDLNEKEDLLESYELLKEDGFSVKLINDPKAIKHWSGSHAFKVGLYFPFDKSINPLKYVYNLKKKAQSKGVEFITDKYIERIEDNEFLVDEYNNRIHFDICIVATNWNAVNMFPKLKDKIWAVRGQMLATEIIHVDGIAMSHCHHTRHGYEYFKFYNNRIVLGGKRTVDEHTEETHKCGINDKIQAALEEFIKEIYGMEPKIEHRWSGIMCNSKDGFPIIGPLNHAPNIVLAIAGNGYGMSYSYGIANAVKDILLNGKYDLMDLLGTRRIGL